MISAKRRNSKRTGSTNSRATQKTAPQFADLKAYIWKLPELGIYNVIFLIADVIQLVSGTMTTFSQGDGTKTKSKHFSDFASRINTGYNFPSFGLKQFGQSGIK